MLGWYVRRLAEGGLVAALTATSPARLAHPDGGEPLGGHEPARDRDPELGRRTARRRRLDGRGHLRRRAPRRRAAGRARPLRRRAGAQGRSRSRSGSSSSSARSPATASAPCSSSPVRRPIPCPALRERAAGPTAPRRRVGLARSSSSSAQRCQLRVELRAPGRARRAPRRAGPRVAWMHARW